MAEKVDIFKRNQYKIQRPVTADMVNILWDGKAVAQATNVSIQYQQQVTRRYTLASNQNMATIYPGRPIGSITIARLFADNTDNIFNQKGWDVCSGPASLTFFIKATQSSTADCNLEAGEYTADGCYVTGYNFQADADSLSVIDNLQIEFLQLSYKPS